MTQLQPGMGITTFSDIYAITDNHFVRHDFKISNESKEVETNKTFIQKKITADYSNDIIGLWEGVEMTGDETYGNAEARIAYHADGTYTYYKKENGEWQPLEDVFDEWNVDGDWLATRWQNQGSDVMNYEWWDIDYIKDGKMKWSALREKEDGTRFKTTFTWKKVK